METARERLAEFLSAMKWSQAQAASRFGCSQGLVSKILRGERAPGLALAFSIKGASLGWDKGPIRPCEWVTPAPTEEAAAEAEATEAPATDPEGDSNSEPAAA